VCTTVCVYNCVLDASVYYFVVMIRHGFHIIFTQMVSTHDAMVRGSLDFPNLINLNNITQDFAVDVEIYGMVGRYL
jgi:actin-binding protein anillin